MARREHSSWSFAAAVLVAALAVSFSLLLSEREAPCIDDPSLAIQGQVVFPCDCFSESFTEAREKFLSAAESLGADLHVIPIYQNYTTDIAIIRGDDPGLVIHTSGVHGVEGYAGSAIQVAWMRSLHQAEKQKRDLPTLVFVHAVNPYGMAHFRRTNENNVDLNRNALLPDEWAIARNRDPNIAGYEDFRNVFDPPELPSNWWLMAAPLVMKHGVTTLKRAMVTGQYHSPAGILFGGNKLEPSWEKLYAFMEINLPSIDKDRSSKVMWVNVHTGLGPYARGTLLVSDAGVRDPESLPRVFEGTFMGLSAAAKGVNSGYELALGMPESLMRNLFEDDRDVWLVGQEFGTLHTVLVGRSLMMENTIHHHHPEKKDWAVQLMKAAFYPRKASWRKGILTEGIRFLTQAINRTTNKQTT